MAGSRFLNPYSNWFKPEFGFASELAGIVGANSDNMDVHLFSFGVPTTNVGKLSILNQHPDPLNLYKMIYDTITNPTFTISGIIATKTIAAGIVPA